MIIYRKTQNASFYGELFPLVESVAGSITAKYDSYAGNYEPAGRIAKAQK